MTNKAPALLSGGNPQIPKGEGDGPVQAYIAAMPGWKRAVGRRLDTLIGQIVPDVRKAVKWNTPFYGLGDDGWFLGFHCFTRYVKITFFRGAVLHPMPPVPRSSPACGITTSMSTSPWMRPGFRPGSNRPAGCRASNRDGRRQHDGSGRRGGCLPPDR
ncbi:DUF1801 domain-containing protein [Roseomonas sp. CAU 1739]|uniref:DUF1801 domain-containing protein n=1 Tax=Roseomonas sp. CAU 1739 TaxID=3140364 RepID=UPI00325B236A